jgi:hypothetical protein
MVIDLETDVAGRLNIHAACARAKQEIDDEDRESLIDEALAGRIKQAAQRGKTAARAQTYEQGSFPFEKLRRAHAIDTDERVVVTTTEMTQMQFKRAIEIREKQVADDQAYLKELTNAYMAVRPIWDEHPEWTFGQCCNEMIRQRAA